MKRIKTLLVTGCIAAFTGAAANAGAPPGSWYIMPQVNAVWVDDDRHADDDVGVTLAIGRNLNANWDLEMLFFGSDHDRANNGSVDLQGFALGTKRVFYRDGRVNPFLSLGIGQVKSLLNPGYNDEDLSLLFGGGVLIDLGPQRNDGSAIQLRGDLGARRGLSDNADLPHVSDYVAGLGLQYSWGGTPVRPPPADSDGDGVTDDLDRCPNTPTGTPVDATGCPLPQDDDGDGVMNPNDKCPGTPPGKKVDAVGCEVDGDDDGDGILNSVDQCPDSPAGTRVNNVGCPFDRTLLLQGVKFDTNKDTLLPESIPILDNAVATLKRYPDVNIEVQGHTDSRGAEAYNQDLSARRAATVLKYLKDGGVTNQLTSRGFGESDPIASNDTEDGRQQNRRVVLVPLN